MMKIALKTLRRLIEIFQKDDHPWRRISAAAIARSRLGELLKIKIRVQDHFILLHPASLSTLLWYDSNFRSEDSEFMRAVLRAGETCIDVGANIGVTAIPAAITVGQGGRVIVFEPHPKTCRYLQENIALNGIKNIEVQRCALGDTRGSTFFTNKSTDDMNQIIGASRDAIEVPIALLDDFAQDCEQIALLKIDVEGYEKFVIAGATELIKKVTHIYFEVDEKNFSGFGYNSRDLLQQLAALGFSFWRRSGRGLVVSSIDIDSFMPTAAGYENIIGTRNIQDLLARTNWQRQDAP